MTVRNSLMEIIRGLGSLLTGMRVTMANMRTQPHTVQWPRETAPLPPAFRGHIQLVVNEATGYPRCIACSSCARNCPSQCIVVSGKKPAGAKKKLAERFLLDFTTCSLCGICVESCPVGGA